MNKMYCNIEIAFEILTTIVTKVLGNSITFILAFCLVIYWWATNLFTSNDTHQNIGDIIFGTTFLSLFIIQKSFNKYSALIHSKLNELVSSNQEASNSVLNTSKKSESEIIKMAKVYAEEIIEEEIEKIIEENQKENEI
ncbi:MAG: low affinity iron permease family protein [Flavobacterium sp.]|uniref:low affinity iron permease family protein n=1 Tax=Flavobacterium sp. TaxID=239 RepID=UPI0022BB90F1|nr:low affinity iron permease family protein [Flavobacterium sp.]MCZ8196282.1 low affinity iron permease family protein [Flavobacterium sp.]